LLKCGGYECVRDALVGGQQAVVFVRQKEVSLTLLRAKAYIPWCMKSAGEVPEVWKVVGGRTRKSCEE
jgi:hypothetical protein